MGASRILIVDDHPLFREALQHALRGGLPEARMAEAGSLDAARQLLEKNDNFDLILLDLRMPGVQGLSGLIYLRTEFPNIPIVIISANEEPGIVQKAVGLGALGYIPKSAGSKTIIEAVTAALDGEVWAPEGFAPGAASDTETEDVVRRVASLTAQQIRVLMMLKEGLLNKQIAYELNVSEATIKAHVSAILQKLKVSSRTQAVIAATRLDSGGREG